MRLLTVGLIKNFRWDAKHENQYANIVAFGGNEVLEVSSKNIDLEALSKSEFYVEFDLDVAFFTTGSGKETRQRARVERMAFNPTKIAISGAGLFSQPVLSGNGK